MKTVIRFMPQFLKIILIFFSCFLTYNAKTQTYLSLGLDTSCYWIHDFNVHGVDWNNNIIDCVGETISYVEKDTNVNGINWAVVKTFTTEANNKPICNSIYPNGKITYVKEDTVLKTITRSLYLTTDFKTVHYDVVPGDTLFGFDITTRIVDSIQYIAYNGIVRKTIYSSTLPPFPAYTLVSIEGIGTNYNFLPIAYQEFGYPAMQLKCYSKNGTTYYGDSLIPCYKKPFLPISVNDYNLAIDICITSYNKVLTITLVQMSDNLELSIINTIGQRVFTNSFKDVKTEIDLSNQPAGIYFLEVRQNNKKLFKKFVLN